jgi:hypothetical protein
MIARSARDLPEQLRNDLGGCKANGSHRCDGVFGKSTLVWKQDPELILLVCRGLPGEDELTIKFGSDDDDVLSDFTDDIREVFRRVFTDPEKAEKPFDAFPTKSQAYASAAGITGWLAVRWAADYGRKGQIADLFKQLEDELDSEAAEQCLAVPRYADGFTAAAKSKPEEFFATLDITPGELPKKISAIPGVAAARQALDAKKAKFAADTWIPDNTAVDAAQAKSRANGRRG